MTREEGYKITFIVQHKTRAYWKLGPDPAFSLCFHENRGVPNFRPSLLYRIRISFPFLISHPVPNFPRFLGSRQIPYPINLYHIPGIPFQTRGKKSPVICHLFDTGIVGNRSEICHTEPDVVGECGKHSGAAGRE